MGYGIKHTTSNISNTLRRGNVATTAAHSANPSNNFYSGIALVDGKHTVVKVHSTNDPDFYSLTDTEFIEFVTSLGANIYGVIGAKNYIQSQNDLFYIDNVVYNNAVNSGLRLDLNSKYDESFINNKPTTNLVSNSSMIPSSPTSFYTGGPGYASNVGGSGWGWSYYPNSNVSDDGGMIWNPNMEDPYGQPGVWIMKKRPGGNSESNWAGSAPGAIDSTKDHVVSVWCKTDQASCFRIHINVTQNGSSYWGYASSFHTGGSEWERLSVVIPKDSGNTSINVIRCQAIYTTITADAQWKYYQIEEGLTPTDWVDGSRSQNTTWYDLSGYSNNWTPLNDVTFNGQSFEFNGTTSYMQDSVSSFNPDGAPNVMEVLFKPMDLGSRRQAIFSDNYGPEYGIWIYSDNTLRGVAYTSVQTSNIEVGRWYYAVLNIQPGANKSSTDQTYIQFYVNGQFIGENNNNTGNGMNDQPFSLGFDYKSNNPNDFFSGSIALAKLSYGEYSQENVNQNYYGGNIVTDGLVLAVDAGNLVSYESGSTIVYNMTGSTSGSLNNGTTYLSNNGGTWDFDGTDDTITVKSNHTFSSGESYTYEVWFNPTTDNTTSGLIGGQNNPMLRWGQGSPSGKVYFFCGYSESPGYIGVLSNSILPVGEWHHAMATLDSVNKVGKLYINGEYETQFTWSTGTVSVPPSTILFNMRDSSNAYLGKISTGRVYNRALTAQEIQQNYIAQKARFSS
jgi:hypothetical protein